MAVLVYAVDRPDLPPFPMSDRFRHEITYFMSLPGEPDVPILADGEYWISADRVARWLDEGVFSLVSPLDSQNRTEIELSEEQESWLQWMADRHVQHVKLASP
jgi:hypothetical protein